MTEKAFPDLQHGLAAVHLISINRKPHTTIDETVELFRHVLEKHAKAAAETPPVGTSTMEPALPRSLTIFSPPFGPKDYGTVRLGLQLAELERQMKEEALRERHATERLQRIEKLQRMFPGAKLLPSGALVTADGEMTLEFAPGSAAKAIAELEAEEEERARRQNPHGVPVIFPGYD